MTKTAFRGREARGGNRPFTQLLLVMKLTLFLLTAACLHVSANGFAQNVTFSGRAVPLEKVFTAVESQTGYFFLYPAAILRDAKKITVDVRDMPLGQFLDLIFTNQSLKYSIDSKTINVSLGEKEKEADKTNQIVSPPVTVTGIIRDSTGSPLVRASIKIRGTQTATSTNEKGQFSIDVNEGDILEISFVGYVTLSLRLVDGRFAALRSRQTIGDEESILLDGSPGSLLIRLATNTSSLQEVIINKGYYTEKQKFSAGNVATVKADVIEKQPVQNPLLALQGRAPGLVITQQSGLSGSAVTVRIQGQNTFLGQGQNPLFVIDGIPYISDLGLTGASVNIGGSNPLNFINPADIDEISILKDADATAIYGSRAANGAILITTKKGKIGDARVNLNMQQGWGELQQKMPVLNTRQYLDMRYEALANDGIDWKNSTYAANDLKVWDTTRQTDWQKVLLGKKASYSNINASISGGTSRVQYRLGALYHRETTVFPSDFADRKGGVNIDLNAQGNRLSAHFSTSYVFDDNRMSSLDLTGKALTLSPNAPPLHSSDGSLNWAPNAGGASTWINPLAYMLNLYQLKTTNLVSGLTLGYQLFPGLQIKTVLGYTNTVSNEFSSSPLSTQRPEYRAISQRQGRYGNSNINSWTVEPQLNFDRKLGEGKFSALVGATVYRLNTTGQDIYGTGYNSDIAIANPAAATSLTVAATTFSVYNYSALFGRFNYNWREKYIVNLTARRDGSSRFGSENLFNNFASIGGVWIFSEESFFKNSINFIDFGKLRASYGTTGNDQIGNYAFMSLYYPTVTGVSYQSTVGLAPSSSFPNPYLQWEETKKLQLGIDFSLLNQRILLGATFARNRSSNLLAPYTIPSLSGASSVTVNFPALIQNTSAEFTLETKNIVTRSFQWITDFNLTFPKNKLIDFPNLAASSYANSLVIGQPVNIIKVYHYLGVNTTTGLYEVADKDGKPTITPNYNADRTTTISTSPKFYGGLHNKFLYKDFQLDVFLQFTKQVSQNNYLFGSFIPGFSGYNQPTTVLGRWQKIGDNAQIQKYNTDLSVYGPYGNVNASDAVFVDGSYIRLKNISLSWNLPDKWKQNAHIPSAQLYLQAQNVLTITNYKGLDPETGNGSLPPLRILTFGLRVGF